MLTSLTLVVPEESARIGGIGKVVLKPSATVTFSGADLLVLLDRVKIKPAQPTGGGTKDTPWRMSNIRQWHHAASYYPMTDHCWYLIGGRLIRRHLLEGGDQDNYISDWDKDRFSDDHGPTYPQIHAQLVKDSAIGEVKKDASVAAQIRALLKGDQELKLVPSKALPALTAALFLAEVNRNPLSLPIGLILLDFAQRGVTYGDDGVKTYSWTKILWHPSKFGDAEHAKKPQLDAYGAKKDADRWGGKHPMAHHLSVPQTTPDQWGFVRSGVLNEVRQKEASLLIRWLALQLRRTPGLKVVCGTDALPKKAVPTNTALDDASDAFEKRQKAQTTLSLNPQSKSGAKDLAKADAVLEKHRIAQRFIVPYLLMRCSTLDAMPI